MSPMPTVREPEAERKSTEPLVAETAMSPDPELACNIGVVIASDHQISYFKFALGEITDWPLRTLESSDQNLGGAFGNHKLVIVCSADDFSKSRQRNALENIVDSPGPYGFDNILA